MEVVVRFTLALATKPYLALARPSKIRYVSKVISNKSYDGAPTYRSTATPTVPYAAGLRDCETRGDGVADTQTTTAQVKNRTCYHFTVTTRKVLVARISSALSRVSNLQRRTRLMRRLRLTPDNLLFMLPVEYPIHHNHRPLASSSCLSA